MDASGVASAGGIPRIQVFRPTWEEFKDFNKFILYMEQCGAHKAGLAKIIPPPEWNPCKNGYDMDKIGKMEIPAPISQVVQGKQGVYQQFNILKKAMTVKDFRKMAESPKYATPIHFDYEDLDRKYWRNICYTPAIYGADVSGSLTDPDVKEWNINKLGSILDYVEEDYGISIEGVNTAYLYFGMWKSSFAWHTEDMDLYSINYLHFGEPKSWYSVPPEYGARLERLAQNHFPSNHKECPAFLRHKMTTISPSVLKTHSIPFNKIVQEKGEFMVTFPYGYHAGYNHGFNCAESTNFASPRWVEYGKRATQCACRPDMVKISMDTFVQRFQPERYELWLQGKDIGCHPEIPGKYSAAPHPSREEILCNKVHNQCIPESFAEPPVKKKAKRHLIHKQPQKDFLQPETPPPELYPESEYSDEALRREQECEDDDVAVASDEETFEVMKDVLYKAGEMESDGLEEWEEEVKSKRSKKSGGKRANKSDGSSSSGCDSPRPASNVGPRARPVAKVKESIQSRRFKVSDPPSPHQGPSGAGSALSGFRIPKRAQQEASRGPCWTEEENSAGQALLNLCEDSAKKEVMQLPDDQTQKPSGKSNANAQRSPHPPALVRYGAAGGSGQMKRNASLSPPPLIVAGPSDLKSPGAHPASSTSRAILQHVAASIKTEQTLAGSGQWSSCSSGSDVGQQQRRARKQKSPRKDAGLSVVSSRLVTMWRGQKDWTMSNEAEFNRLSSLEQPYCSVCALLYNPIKGSAKSGTAAVPNSQLPTSSPVLLPEELFTRSPMQAMVITSSALLRCASCQVCVHARCYGVDPALFLTGTKGWLCRRCERQDEPAKCCLCLQRGGALKPTSDGRWAHLTCAVSLPEVSFGDSAAREPIIVAHVGMESDLLSYCVFCSDRSGDTGGFYRGVCLACERTATCSRTFHPACGLVNGTRYHLDARGQVSGTCCQIPSTSSSASSMKRKPILTVDVGQRVYAKNPADGRFYPAEVIANRVAVMFYWVDFEDGTRSRDTYPEDILNYDCLKFGPPPKGAAVQVQWTDGNNYSGHFQGYEQKEDAYKLKFLFHPAGGDGTKPKHPAVIRADRSEFYLPDEEMSISDRSKLVQLLT